MAGGVAFAFIGSPARAAGTQGGLGREELSTADMNEIAKLVQQYYQHRADSITASSWKLSTAARAALATREMQDGIDADAEKLHEARILATRAHGGYRKAVVSIRLQNPIAAASECRVGIIEETALQFAGPHPTQAPASKYIIRHEVHLIRATKNKWRLASAQFIPRGALPPLTQWASANGQEHSKAENDQTSAHDSEVNTERTQATLDAAARRLHSPRPDNTRYNYSDMISWAEAWWNGRNPKFPNYDNDGGDCTNFVSQCMLAGGWATAGPPGANNLAKWFYSSSINQCSHTWGGAQPWHSFATIYSQRMKELNDIWAIQPADVLQFDLEGSGSIDHTQFCSAYHYDETSLEFYMTQHDEDYWYRPLSEIVARLSNDKPNCKYHPLDHVID